MSQKLISRSPDLSRLQDEGYSIRVVDGALVLDLPYLTSKKEVGEGTLISSLTLKGDVANYSGDHTVWFVGEHPCNLDGTPIRQLTHSQDSIRFGSLTTSWKFSNKPASGYVDYYDKMTSYVRMIEGPARAVDNKATAMRHLPVATEADSECAFVYEDTASSRAGIVGAGMRLRDEVVAIVGIGGTGAYVLDFIAKTPVRRIDAFDDDTLHTHGAFRAPGAVTIDDLRAGPLKAVHHAKTYSRMHKHIVAHPLALTPETFAQLDGVTFVFVCIDDGPAKLALFRELERRNLPFVDTGIGVERTKEESLVGVVRVTTSLPGHRDHLVTNRRINFDEPLDGGLYDSNVQIAELNALAACLAVIKWKKLRGYYADFENELHSTYTVDGNIILNDDATAAQVDAA